MACVATAEDPEVLARLGGERPATTVFEMSNSMYLFLENAGVLPKWARCVRIGARVLVVDARMLPCLDLLPHAAARVKGPGGRTMIDDSKRAAKIEVPIYDAIILAAFLDVLAAAALKKLALAKLAEQANRKGPGRKSHPDPVLERLAAASVVRLPRLTSE